MATAAIVIAALLLAAILYGIARLISTDQSRLPPLARLRGAAGGT